ncbi:PEP-CTERM sorting domain-containing protein [Pelagibius sp. Alg239-R121]|uniref:PEP-CTERM sorting domain-containing protein n=1 Tax=Pelagibius sp. Alg239-R121 TaxID=2993448 RepID=UPI0024A625F1|nr:PEP-CTERM sorting domain-containing protein [Pelagibius sp. Alg239-R121]
MRILSVVFSAILGGIAMMSTSVSAMPMPATPMIGCDTATDLACRVFAGQNLTGPSGPVTVPNNGNDKENVVEAALFDVFGSFIDVMEAAKSDDNPSRGLSITGAGSSSGTWTYTGVEELYLLTVKASNDFSIYNIEGLTTGPWTTEGLVNGGGNTPNISHVTVWKLVGGTTTQIPEPGTLALLLLGLAGLTIAAQRQKATATQR